MDYYKESIETVLSSLNTSTEGIMTEDAKKRQEEQGFNEISRKDRQSTLSMFIDTFKDPLVIVLLIVAIVQIVLGEAVESLIIFAVLIINSILSVVQTKKADASLLSFRLMAPPTTKVKKKRRRCSRVFKTNGYSNDYSH